MILCTDCGTLLTDNEIDNCDGLCRDCCEEEHLNEDIECENHDCGHNCEARLIAELVAEDLEVRIVYVCTHCNNKQTIKNYPTADIWRCASCGTLFEIDQ